MRTVSYRLGDLARATINIGKVAENEYTRVQFNAEQIFAEYPAATAALSVINPAGTAYPAVVTREGDLIIWDVTDADLTAAGMGELQLTLTENGVVIKSYIARTRIERSIVASGSAPDPVQSWLDNAAEVLEEVQDAIPAGGTTSQVMGKLSDDDYDIGWIDQTGGGGGGGTSNYNDLSNKPQIAGTTLSGNKSLEQLGIASADAVSAKYTKPASGIPASDLASGVQTSLGKADSAYQKPGSGIPASDMESGVIPVLTDLIDDTAGDGDTDKVWSADKTAEEVETLSSAIANLTEEETATLTNAVSINSLPAYSGMKKIGVTDGVATYKTSDSPSTSPALRDLCDLGTGDWVVSFKYKLTKNNQQLGDFDHVKVYTGNSEIHYYPATYGEWVYVQIFTKVNLTRVYIMLDSFTSAPAEDDLTLQIKDYYVYGIGSVHGDILFHVIDSQRKSFKDGQVTYTTEAIKNVPVNVKDYGAKGDGETDDTDVINAIMRSFNGKIYFPSGTYKISETIEVPGASVLYGDGVGTVIDMYQCNNLKECLFRAENSMIYPYILVQNRNTVIRDIKLTGNNMTCEARHAGILILDTDTCMVHDVTVYNINTDENQSGIGSATVSGYGIAVHRSNFTNVERCNVEKCGYECIGIIDDCDHCVVRDCYTKDGWRCCIQVHRGSSNTIIENCYMKMAQDEWHSCFTIHGLEEQKCENISLLNCICDIDDTGAQPYDYCAPLQIMSYADKILIMGNKVFGGKRALYITTSTHDAKVIGNDLECNDDSDYGVYITSDNAIIIGNRLDNKATTKTNTLASSGQIVFGNIGIGDTIYNASGVSF